VLVTTAVVPGPPAFVAELMGSAAHELDDLRDAADRVVSRALSDLLSLSAAPRSTGSGSLFTHSGAGSGSQSTGSGTRAGMGMGSRSGSGSGSGLGLGAGSGAGSGSGSAQLVVVGPGEPGEFNATGPVSFASFGREVVVPGLVPGQPDDREQPGDCELPTPIMVARYLASRDIAAHPEHAQLWASARWVTTSGGDATALGEQLGADRTPVGLILVADGAACHGPKAPQAEDDRAQAYDDGVDAALASGLPSLLATIKEDLGAELGATGAMVWPLLVAAAGATDPGGTKDPASTTGAPDAARPAGMAHPEWSGDMLDWVGEVAWKGAPYGVGWTVASWRRPCQ
jgi:hypothetical protein